MVREKEFWMFSLCFFIPFFFYRIIVLLRGGEVSVLRGITGYSVHHSHYGILLVLIGVLAFLFVQAREISLVLSGLGLGSILDSFVSSLMPSVSRAEEVLNYTIATIPTFVLLVGIWFIALMLFVRSAKN